MENKKRKYEDPKELSPQSEKQQPRDDEGISRACIFLNDATDLPTTYAALKLVKDMLRSTGHDDDPPEEHLELIQNASLAVPYLMYQMAVEIFTEPKTLGGLAFPSAKAKSLAKDIFEKAGVSACSMNTTESSLKLQKAGIDQVDARKILPKLKHVGDQARSKVEEIQNLFEKGCSKD